MTDFKPNTDLEKGLKNLQIGLNFIIKKLK